MLQYDLVEVCGFTNVCKDLQCTPIWGELPVVGTRDSCAINDDTKKYIYMRVGWRSDCGKTAKTPPHNLLRVLVPVPVASQPEPLIYVLCSVRVVFSLRCLLNSCAIRTSTPGSLDRPEFRGLKLVFVRIVRSVCACTPPPPPSAAPPLPVKCKSEVTR